MGHPAADGRLSLVLREKVDALTVDARSPDDPSPPLLVLLNQFWAFLKSQTIKEEKKKKKKQKKKKERKKKRKKDESSRRRKMKKRRRKTHSCWVLTNGEGKGAGELLKAEPAKVLAGL